MYGLEGTVLSDWRPCTPLSDSEWALVSSIGLFVVQWHFYVQLRVGSYREKLIAQRSVPRNSKPKLMLAVKVRQSAYVI